jgi:Rrf2 family protein
MAVQDNDGVRISAKADYAVRAAITLAAAEPETDVAAEAIARSQDIPYKFLEAILTDLRREGVVTSSRGPRGGYRLSRPAGQVTVADVIRAVDGPLVSVRGERPPDLAYVGAAEPLLPLWIGLRANVRSVLEGVTLADLAAGRLPGRVRRLAEDPQAWENP